jgi:tRNA A-37 threonylcarbamoyl transferase component Bud32
MRPVAAGRASEIFDLGDGRILRRFKAGGDPEREARVMRHARARGYPVPEVLEVGDDALVLERINGPTMLQDVFRRPWRLRKHALLLAGLHKRLHEIDGLDGGRLLHLDLHPENVILSEAGPVVIDWTNAQGGEPALDVAMAWVILATTGGIPGRLFVRAFLPQFDVEEVRRTLPEAADLRLRDANVTEREREAVRRLRYREAGVR